MSDVSFGAWLKAQLRRRDWTQADFARRSGMTTTSVSDWINNKKVPDPASCDRIADALFLPLDDVLVAAGHKPTEDANAEARRLATRAVRDMVMLGLERIDAVNRAQLIDELMEYYKDDLARLRQRDDDDEET
jgi:transcriptional regulator with XRE-family HTH domain